MSSKVKNNPLSKLKKGLSLLTMCLMMIVSIFTFTACKLRNNSGSEQTSTFDAEGNLRIEAPTVEFNPYSVSGTEHIIDDKSGSFTWDLSYYLARGNKKQLQSVDFDQSQFLANFVLNSSDLDSSYLIREGSSFYNYYNNMAGGVKPVYTSSLVTLKDSLKIFETYTLQYRDNLSNDDYYAFTTDASFTNIVAIPKSVYNLSSHTLTECWYGYDMDSVQFTNGGITYSSDFKIVPLYTPSNYLLSNSFGVDEETGENLSVFDVIDFPDFEVVVDGKFYTFDVIVNKEYLDINKNSQYNMFKDKSVEGEKNLFTFKYRTGKSSGAGASEWMDCSEDLMTYEITSEGKFIVRFNPMLEAGSKNRYIKVRALENVNYTLTSYVDASGATKYKYVGNSLNNRADSLYSSTYTYEAYTMTFETYSPNSVDYAYLYDGAIHYDETKYYFHTQKTTYDKVTNETYLTSVTGVFPEGRQIIIDRKLSYDDSDDYLSDYALQNWTVNAKAETSYVLEQSMPNGARYDSGFYINNTTKSPLYEALLVETDAMRVVSSQKYAEPRVVNYQKSNYLPTHGNVLFDSNLVYEDLQGGQGVDTVGTLYVSSHATINGYKFYSNYAKVRNFSISGTFFDGDNFFTDANQYLNNVNVFVYNKNKTTNPVCYIGGSSENRIVKDLTSQKRYTSSSVEIPATREIVLLRDNAEFTITGLDFDDFLVFEREGSAEGAQGFNTLAYSFHSPEMEKILIDRYKQERKTLDVLQGERKLGDYQNLGIIGTKYPEQSNLIVNIYSTNADNTNRIEANGLTLLQNTDVKYEIIKTSETFEDEDGYITTNVIISLILPSNSILTGYNVETVNNVTRVYYKANDTKFVAFQKFNAETAELETTDYYGNFLTGSVTKYGTTRLKFNGDDYIYSSTVGSSSHSRTTYILSSGGKSGIYKIIEVDGTSYEFYDHSGNRLDPESPVFYTYSYSNVSSSSIKKDNTSSYLEYAGELFVYDHKDKVGTTTRNTYKQVSVGSQVKEIVETINGSSATYTVYTYTQLNQESLDFDYDSETLEPYLIYNGTRIEIDNTVSQSSNEIGIIGDVYPSLLVQKKNSSVQNVYFYYDVKKASNDKYYFYAPLGKQTTITTSAETKVETSFYFDNISVVSGTYPLTKAFPIVIRGKDLYANHYYSMIHLDTGLSMYWAEIEYNSYYYVEKVDGSDTVKVAKVMMLGSDIYSYGGTDKDVIAFKEMMGAKIISSCYYYVRSLNEPIKAVFNQNNRTVEDANQIQVVTRYYDSSKNQITSVAQTILEDELYLTPTLSDGEGSPISSTARVDLQKLYKYQNKTLNETLVNYTNTDKVPIGSSKYVTTHSKIQIGEDYYYLPQYTNGIYTKLTLYHIVERSGLKEVVGVDLYYDKESGNYYKITAERRVVVKDDAGDYETVVYAIDDTSPMKITTKESSSNLLNSLIVDKINNVSQIKEHTKKTATKVESSGTTSYSLTSTIERFPTAFLVPTYYVGNNKENQQAYLGLTTGNTKFANFSALKNNLVEYREYDPSNGNVKGESLYVYEGEESVYNIYSSLVREAKTLLENQSITVIGKYVQAGNQDESIVYPSFSLLDVYDESQAVILGADANGLYNHYYDLDYTSTNNVKEGFPGVVLLAGIPYPNPVLHFSVRHKTSEDPVINISLDIKEAYYVEIMGTNVKTEDSNLIKDFTTYSFKDTLLNLQLNDYIDKSYQILDKTTLKPIYAYVKNSNGTFSPFISDEKGNPIALNIQDVGMNENDPNLYDKSKVNVNGEYIEEYALYMKYVKEDGSYGYRKIHAENDAYIWETSTKKVVDVATYDIHSYVQDKDGIIYFDSGSVTDDNIVCIGLKGIEGGATKDSNGYYNYDQVLVAGVTNAYRTKLTQLKENPYGGYQSDVALSILDAYDSKDAYFLTGREAVVVTTNPTIKISNDEGVSTIYRFKEWQVYSRYNSEVLYFNKYVTSQLELNKGNAILTFYADNAGYYVFLPVYERVLSIDMGTAVIDGPINQGGSIEVYYKDGSEVDIENSSVSKLYFNELLKTGPEGDETYQYGDIAGVPYLYFTGRFREVNGIKQPVFKIVDDIYVFNLLKTVEGLEDDFSTNVFFRIKFNGNRISEVEVVPYVYNLVEGKEGIVPLTNNGGAYRFAYSIDGYTEQKEDFLTTGLYCLDTNNSETVNLEEVINYSYNSLYYSNSILNDEDNQERYYTPLHLNENNELVAIDLNELNNYHIFRDRESNNSQEIIPIYLYLLVDHMRKSEFNISIGNAINQIGEIFYEELYAKEDSLFIKNTLYAGFKSYLYTDVVAKSISHDFNMVPVVNGILQTNGLYLSKNGSLSASELVTDKDGNLYTTQQFKTCYIDRDSYVEITAVPEYGYRLEGWYKCVYDENVNAWFTTDEKIENSEDIYSDEVIQAYYNKFNDKYYYVTNYYIESNVNTGLGTQKSRIYFFDSLKQEPAEVPDRMLNNVRGYFINNGTSTVKNYVQVYAKGDNRSYYYDKNFTMPVDMEEYEIEELTFIDAINRNSARLDLYTLNNVVVYRKMVTDEFGYTTERFYRAKTTGNIVVDGDTLKIKTLHANVRYVAKFIETYNEYIFTEDPTISGIKIEAIYYNSNDARKNLADGSDPTIRTDEFGNNRTGLTSIYNSDGLAVGDYAQNKLDTSLLGLIDKEKNPDATQKYLDASFMQEQFNVKLADNTTRTYKKYEAKSVEAYNLLTSGFANFEVGLYSNVIQTQTYRVNENDPTLDGRFNLRGMNFDIDTNVYILVSVKSTDVLSIHSLGMNSHYELIPIIEPTDAFVEYNNAEKDEANKVDYHYYLFRVTYNRDPENEYSNYIVHPKRGQSFAYDVMAGNFYSFYGQYFDIYDNYGNKIQPIITADGQTSLINYVYSLWNNGKITYDIYSTIANRRYANIAEGLEDLCYELRQLDAYYVDYITLKTDPTTELRDLDDIYNAIKELKDENDEYVFESPRLIYSGQRNFINLSTIPIYQYTVQALTIDSFEQTEGKDDFIYSEDGKVVLHNGFSLYKVKDEFYTAAGYNSKTYVGYGTKDTSTYVYIDDKYTDTTKFTFEQRFTEIGYSTGSTGKVSSARMEDLPFAQDTVILFSGAAEFTIEDFESESEEILDLKQYYGIDQNIPASEAYEQYLEILNSYAFVGWFEQKYDRVEKSWTDLVLMSKDMEYPYLSVAQEDTIIVAVFKKVVDLSITFKTKELTVQLPNGGYDDLGNPITVTSNDETGITTITGKFYFDSEPNLVLNPTGGYRLDAINIGQIEEDPDQEIMYYNILNKDSKYLSFYEFEYDEANNTSNSHKVAFDEFSLNGAMQITLPFMKEFKNRYRDKDFTRDTISIELSTKRTVLTYFRIENYTNNGQWSGYNFIVYKGDESNFYINTNGLDPIYNLKDSANNNLAFVLDGSNLTIYGYFDNDIGDLKIKTDKGSSTRLIDQWYINGFTNPTADYSQFSKLGEFDVIFEYAGTLESFNSDELFALDQNNSIYYARAVIEVNHVDLVIGHTFIKSYGQRSRVGLASGEDLYASANVRSKLTYNGDRYYTKNGVQYIQQNGAIATANVQTYQFDPIAQIGLSIEDKYIIYDGELYVFIGWYKGNNVFDFGIESTLVSEKEYIDGVLAGSATFYEAKYCLAKELDIVVDEYTNYVIDGGEKIGYCNLPEIDSQYYLVGYNPKIYITPSTSYVIDDCIVKQGNASGAEYTNYQLNVMSVGDAQYYQLDIKSPNTDLYINITSDKGVDIVINQTLASSVYTNEDLKLINSTPFFTITYDGKNKTFSNNPSTIDHIARYLTVARDTEVTLEVTNDDLYGFVGWFINGVCVSEQIDGEKVKHLLSHTLTVSEDIVIEARFVPYVRTVLTSKIRQDDSQLSTFSATLSYTDWYTGNTITRASGPIHNIMSGIVITVSETRPESSEGRPYSFVGWNSYTFTTEGVANYQFKEEISKYKTFTTILAPELMGQDNNVAFIAEYSKTLIASLNKEISIRPDEHEDYFEDKTNGIATDEFNGLFDVVIEFKDKFGETRRLSMSSLESIENIPILAGSKATITYKIDPTLADRYMLEYFEYTSYGITTNITNEMLANGYYEFDFETIQTSDFKVKAIFSPASYVTITRVVNDKISTNNVANLSYSFLKVFASGQVDYAVGSLADGVDCITVLVPMDCTYTITHGANSSAGCELDGWFVDGVFHSKDASITNNAISSDKKFNLTANHSIVADYSSVSNIKFARYIDGEEKSQSTLPLKLTGNVRVEEDGKPDLYLVHTVDVSGSSSSKDIVVLRGSNSLVLNATHLNGYKFNGFYYSTDGGSTWIQIPSIDSTYQTVAEFVPTDINIIVKADYEKEYKVSYVITTINAENGTQENGATINSDAQKYFTNNNNLVEFTLNIQSGYALDSIYIDGNALASTEYNFIDNSKISLNVSTYEDVTIEVRIIKTGLIVKRYLSVAGTIDAAEIQNKLNINLNSLGLGGYNIYNGDAVLVHTMSYSIGGEIELDAASTITSSTGVTYYFNGWFYYNNNGVAYSTYELTKSTSGSIIATKDLNLIAKYELSPNTTSTISSISYEFFDDDIDSPSSASVSLTKSPVNNVLDNYSGKNYMFVGFYAKTFDYNGVSYIKLLDSYNMSRLNSYRGKYTNIVGKFVAYNKVTASISIEQTASYIAYNATTIYAGLKNGHISMQTNDSSSITYRVLDTAKFSMAVYAKEGYRLVNDDTQYVVKELISTTQIKNDNALGEISVYRNGVATLIETQADHISNVVTTVTTNSDDALTTNNVEYSYSVKVELPAGLESSVKVVVHHLDNTTETYEVTSSNKLQLTNVPYGVRIYMVANTASHEAFIEYSLITENIGAQEYNTYTKELDIFVTGHVGITANFSKLNSLVIAENEPAEGTVVIRNTDATDPNKKTINISAQDGYRIKDVYIAEIIDGEIQEYKKYNSSVAGFDINGGNVTNSSADFLGNEYLKGFDLYTTISKNFAIKVDYEKVTTLNLEIRMFGSLYDSNEYYLYGDSSPLTYSELEGLFDPDSYSITDGVFESFYYNGERLDDSSTIDYSEASNIIITANYVQKVKIRLDVNLEYHLDDKTIFNTPTDGLIIKDSNGNIVYDSSVDSLSSKLLTYTPTEKISFTFYDKNGYFEFKWLTFNNSGYDEVIAPTEAINAFSFETDLLNKLVANASGVYVINVVFEEIYKKLKIVENYEGSELQFSTDPNFSTSVTPVQNSDISSVPYISYDCGNLRLTKDNNGSVVLYYPVSLCRELKNIYMRDASFDIVNTTDFMIPEGSTIVFYEKDVTNAETGETISLRFKNYMSSHGEYLAEEYNRIVEIKFEDFSSQHSSANNIYANAVQIFDVEYGYNVCDPNIKIMINLHYLDDTVASNSNLPFKQIALSSNNDNIYNSLIKIKLEEGISITVQVDIRGYTGTNEFYTIAVSTKNRIEDYFTSIDTVSGSDWIGKIPQSDYIPVCNYHDADARFRNYLSSDGIATFHISVNKDLSFIADFLNQFERVRIYPAVVHKNLDNDNSARNQFEVNGIEDKYVGDNFIFTVSQTENQFTYYNILPIVENTVTPLNKQNPSNPKNNNIFIDDGFGNMILYDPGPTAKESHTYAPGDNYLTNVYEYIYGLTSEENYLDKITHKTNEYREQYYETTTKAPQTSMHVQSSSYGSIKVTPMSLPVTYSEHMSEEIVNGYIPLKTEEFDGVSLTFNDKTYSYNDKTAEGKSAMNKILGDKVVTITAPMVEGYFFKGFILVNNSYESTYRIITIGGETIIANASTFTYLPQNAPIINAETQKYESFSTTLTINGNVEVYAIYEARLYIINLKQYEYDEEAEYEYMDDGTGRLTEIPTEAGKIDGNLVVKRGSIRKLTSISYPYIQYVGWTTTKEYYERYSEEDKFKVWTDLNEEEKGLSEEEVYLPENYKDKIDNESVALNYDKALPGHDGTDTVVGNYLSSYTTNNIYISNITNDIDLNIYFTSLSYRVNIHLADVLGAYTYGDDKGQDQYLKYADYIVNDPEWKNPSAGSYTAYFYSNVGSHQAAETSYDIYGDSDSYKADQYSYTIVIDEKDPYIYTMEDINGKDIGYPTKIKHHLIKTDSNIAVAGTKLRYSNDRIIKIAKTSGGYGEFDMYYKRYYEAMLEKYGAYIDLSSYTTNPDTKQPYQEWEKLQAFIVDTSNKSNIYWQYLSSKSQLYRAGLEIIDPDQIVDDNGNVQYKIDNIYNYVNVEKLNGKYVYRLKPGIFTIKIDSKTISSSSFIDSEPGLEIDGITIDVEKGYIEISQKVIATDAGFPVVSIVMGELENKQMSSAATKLIDYIPQTGSEKQQSKSISGFNLGLFNNDDFLDPEYKLGNLDVNVVLIWQEFATPVEASIELNNHTTLKQETVQLTGTNIFELNKLLCKTNQCTNDWSQGKNHVGKHKYEIQSYQLVIVENGAFVYNLISKFKSEFRNDKELMEILDLIELIVFYTYAGSTNGNAKVTETGNMYSGNLDSLSENLNVKVANMLLTEIAGRVGYKLSPDQYLRYHVIDVFEYYRKGIDRNFVNNFVNADDIVITQVLLQTHNRPQQNTFNFLSKKRPWKASHGYTYVRVSELSLSSSIGGTPYKGSESQVVNFSNKNGSLGNGFAQHTLLSGAYLPDQEKQVDYIKSKTSIHISSEASENYDIVLIEHDFVKTPISSLLITVGLRYIASGLLGAITGGFGFVAINVGLELWLQFGGGYNTVSNWFDSKYKYGEDGEIEIPEIDIPHA